MTVLELENEIRAIETEIVEAIGSDFETDCLADLGVVLAFRNHFVFEIDSENPRWVNIYVEAFNNFTPNDLYVWGIAAAGGRIQYLEKCFTYANEHETNYAPNRVKWFRVRPDMDDGPIYPHLDRVAAAIMRVAEAHPEYFCA